MNQHIVFVYEGIRTHPQGMQLFGGIVVGISQAVVVWMVLSNNIMDMNNALL